MCCIIRCCYADAVNFRGKKVCVTETSRVFGRDINELYLTNGNNVPEVLAQCTAFVEKHGLVDGVYRISGVASNIKRLKYVSRSCVYH